VCLPFPFPFPGQDWSPWLQGPSSQRVALSLQKSLGAGETSFQNFHLRSLAEGSCPRSLCGTPPWDLQSRGLPPPQQHGSNSLYSLWLTPWLHSPRWENLILRFLKRNVWSFFEMWPLNSTLGITPSSATIPPSDPRSPMSRAAWLSCRIQTVGRVPDVSGLFPRPLSFSRHFRWSPIFFGSTLLPYVAP
jgi:hypothetical protein